MSLFRRNKRAREEGDEAAAAEPGFAHAEHQTAEPASAEPGAHASADPAAHAAAGTTEQPADPPAYEGGRQAGELDALVGEAPSSRRRGRLRRRLRHLRRVREVLLRDLGGLTFELHRSASGEGGPVLEGKLARLSAVDREIRDLEEHLSDHRAMILREPGIGGTCTACGEIFGSEARYCWACGNPVAAGGGGVPHLAAWSTHPQLTGGAPAAEPAPLQSPSVDSTWIEQEHPTAPLPQMDPETAAAVEPAANEPATGDVGGDAGAMWSDYVQSPAEAAAAPEADPSPEVVQETQQWEAPAEPEPAPAPAPEEDAPAAAEQTGADIWAPPARDATPGLSDGDPLSSPQRPTQS